MPTRNSPVQIPVAGQHIDGTIVAPSAVIPGVLLVHGWDGSQEQYIARAHEIAALGCICLTIDLRGHARHQAQRQDVTRGDNLADVLAAYDTLVAHPAVDPASIAIVGSSYGGYLAALASAVRPVRWLALRAPALYRDENWDVPKGRLDREDLRVYRAMTLVPDDNRVLAACARFRGDVLVVESDLDRTVPHTVVQNYVNAFKQVRSVTYRVLAETDHALSTEEMRHAYGQQLLGWMTEMVLGAKAATGMIRPRPRSPA